MDEQENHELSTSEMLGYVYRYAIYAIEDAVDDFQFDVTTNQGWTKEQAGRGYAMLQRLLASLEAQAAVLGEDL